MAVQFAVVTIESPGTPQCLASSLSPSGPTITTGGVTYPAGSATQVYRQVNIQAAPGNTAGKTIFVGGRDMDIDTLSNVGAALLPGATALPIGSSDSSFALDDIYINTDSSAATEKVLLVLVS